VTDHRTPKGPPTREKTVLGVAPPAAREKTVVGVAPPRAAEKTILGVAIDPNLDANLIPRPAALESLDDGTTSGVDADPKLGSDAGAAGSATLAGKNETSSSPGQAWIDDAPRALASPSREPSTGESTLATQGRGASSVPENVESQREATDDGIEPAGVPRSGVLGKLLLLVLIGGIGTVAYLQRDKIIAYVAPAAPGTGVAAPSIAAPSSSAPEVEEAGASPPEPPEASVHDASAQLTGSPAVAKDAGATRDAGATHDAGASRDAGATHDAGASRDAGAHKDGGAHKDAGAHHDAGSARDAGAPKKK
jgi:hypothetical protein